MKVNFPGIKKVEYIKASELMPDILDVQRYDDVFKIFGTTTEIPIVNLGSFTVVQEFIDDVTSVYIASVQFKICTDDDNARRICEELVMYNHAFVITLVDNNRNLIGLHEKPHPIVTYKYDNDSIESGNRGYIVNINYRNTIAFFNLKPV